jgi:uncharacterized protein (TIGR02996 family)
MEVARWRTLGVELAFDPTRPKGLSSRGRTLLGSVLANLDVERLVKLYPRAADGRLALGQLVLLAPIELAKPPRAPKQQFLAAASPPRRGDRQVITLGLHLAIARNHQHRWEDARWLWDTRAADATEEARWGVTNVPLDLLAPANADEGLRALERRTRPTTGEQAVHAMLLARAGKWREALALYGVTHSLDKPPHQEADDGRGVAKQIWDDALAEQLREIAPWRFAMALERLDAKQSAWGLFTFPAQKTSNYGVELRWRHGTPHLGVSSTGSTTRAPDLWWRWPPDLALLARGAALPSALAPRRASQPNERSLLAQIAAEPRDLEARRVYADLLTEREQPRGEFITLQLLAAEGALDAAGQRRMRQLERIHGRDWLGELGSLIHDPVYERGFVVRCRLGSASSPTDLWQSTVAPEGRAELAAVRDLTVAGTVPAAIANQLLGSLPSLERLAVPVALCHLVTRSLEVLTVDIVWGTEWQAAETCLDRGFEIDPSELRFRVAYGYLSQALDVLPRARQLSPVLRRFVIDATDVTAILSRDAGGELNQLEVLPAAKRRARQLGWILVGTLRGLPMQIARLVVDERTIGNARDELGVVCRERGIELSPRSP